MSAQFDSRAVTESRIKTSASDAVMEEATSWTQGETPHTLKSPLLFKSLVRVSRNNRFPATKNTQGVLFSTFPPGTIRIIQANESISLIYARKLSVVPKGNGTRLSKLSLAISNSCAVWPPWRRQDLKSWIREGGRPPLPVLKSKIQNT